MSMEFERQQDIGESINIAHALSEKAWTEKNYEKYFIIVQVLDFCFTSKALYSKEYFEKKDLIDILYSVMRKKRSVSNDAWLNRWLFEMKLMGLIDVSQDSRGSIFYSLTHLAELHFQNQTFHHIFSSLLESRRTKRLSIIAVLVAAITLLLTLISFLLAL